MLEIADDWIIVCALAGWPFVLNRQPKVSKMKNILLTSAFANANAASKVYVCATAQNTELDQADYEALTWVEIKSVGSLGETGKSTNVLSYDTWDTSVIQKAKGQTDAGSPDLEVARLPNDPGQEILRSASAVGNNDNYAFKFLRADGSNGNTGTVLYNRGLVMGPKRPNGRNEDFDLEVFTLAFQQEEIEVKPLDGGTAPYVTALPAITGTAETGETLTLSNGTWSGDATITYAYAWYRGGSKIPTEHATTYVLVAADEGFKIQGRVTATNDAGSAIAFSNLTAEVTAP